MQIKGTPIYTLSVYLTFYGLSTAHASVYVQPITILFDSDKMTLFNL